MAKYRESLRYVLYTEYEDTATGESSLHLRYGFKNFGSAVSTMENFASDAVDRGYEILTNGSNQIYLGRDTERLRIAITQLYVEY